MASGSSRLKSPSKYLSRRFLKYLLENRCISPNGVEYSEAEVFELLLEKESRHYAPEFDRRLREKTLEPIDHDQIIRDYQDLVWLVVKRIYAK